MVKDSEVLLSIVRKLKEAVVLLKEYAADKPDVSSHSSLVITNIVYELDDLEHSLLEEDR